MARTIWFDPANPKANWGIFDSRLATPPAGWVRAETEDGERGGDPYGASNVYGREQQTTVAGTSSGGFPAYGDTGKYPNGILF